MNIKADNNGSPGTISRLFGGAALDAPHYTIRLGLGRGPQCPAGTKVSTSGVRDSNPLPLTESPEFTFFPFDRRPTRPPPSIV